MNKNNKLEKYQQEIVSTLVENLKKDKDYIKRWSDISFEPCNGHSNHEYQGVNKIKLTMDIINHNASDPRYFTFLQIKEKELSLQKGSSGLSVIYFNFQEREVMQKNGDTEIIKLPFIKTTSVFRASDIENLKPYEQTQGIKIIKNADYGERINTLVKNLKIDLIHGGNQAYYISSKDIINMPPPERFSSKEAYASTLLHEIAHSTGHSSRLDRNLNSVKEHDYAKEELRAEISSAFMCSKLGISYKLENDQAHIDDSSAYVNSWIKTLNNDKSELLSAATDANKITNFLVEKMELKQDMDHNIKQNTDHNMGQENNNIQTQNLTTRLSI